ncbi:hypothetical protein [Variovorax rhizosphaerae]|uniref:Uncharacterized protein n=1 Tax=Variovorax rhizosphaerae TaxID=1836200 RepID=A0ABU8WNV7_9BURK
MKLLSIFRKKATQPHETPVIHDAVFKESAAPQTSAPDAASEPGTDTPSSSAAAAQAQPQAAGSLAAAPDTDHDGDAQQQQASMQPPVGMLREPEIKDFFAHNYYGFGRHHGSRCGTRQAMDLGKQEIAADFQLVLSAMIERRLSKRDRVNTEILKIESFSDELTARLRLTIEHLDRQVGVLEYQATLAEQGQGWVQAALNKFHLGFDRGVTDALDFDLLAA